MAYFTWPRFLVSGPAWQEAAVAAREEASQDAVTVPFRRRPGEDEREVEEEAAKVVAAGGLYVLGGMSHEKFVDPATPYEDLPGLQAQTNAALGGSIALGVTATALTTLTFLRW